MTCGARQMEAAGGRWLADLGPPPVLGRRAGRGRGRARPGRRVAVTRVWRIAAGRAGRVRLRARGHGALGPAAAGTVDRAERVAWYHAGPRAGLRRAR